MRTLGEQEVFEVEVPLLAGRPLLTGNDRKHWRSRATRTRRIRLGVYYEARRAHIPPAGHITVQLHYRPPDNRRRDADNLWPCLKAACDALARGPRRDWVGLEIVPDDTPEHMTKLAPIIHPANGEPRMWLTVEITKELP